MLRCLKNILTCKEWLIRIWNPKMAKPCLEDGFVSLGPNLLLHGKRAGSAWTWYIEAPGANAVYLVEMVLYGRGDLYRISV